jgi:glutamate 5-kinase
MRQAVAAVGQGHLIALYSKAFREHGVTVAQVLLTQEDLADRDRALCVRTTLMRLLELRVLPILNENDSVSVRELVEYERAAGGAAAPAEDAPLGFGDNDGLSARVAVTLGTDLLILLTSVDGLYTADPRHDPHAECIREVERVDDALLARASGASGGGTGGMASKLLAARHATDAGATVLIASGTAPRVLDRLLAGEALGTRVLPSGLRSARRRSIAYTLPRQGAMVVNAGALEALTQRKASLLPIGVLAVEGGFAKGDVVEIRDGSGRVHGRGLANYGADECRAVLGRHSAEIPGILGWQGYDALITRDHMELGEW